MPIEARAIMSTPVITVDEETSVSRIVGILSERGIGAVPVCDPFGALVGMVTQADVSRLLRSVRRDKREADHIRADYRTAADIMGRMVITARPAATGPEMAELMVRHGVRSIPIVEGDRTIGIVSRSDLVRAVRRSPVMAE